jgi:AcrR family transcriptional regulator
MTPSPPRSRTQRHARAAPDRRLPGGRHGLPPEVVAQYQRERLMAGMVRAATEKGYEAITVADVLSEAGVSRATFYKLFDDKLSCFLEAWDWLLAAMIAEVREAYEAESEWPAAVSAALARVLERLAADPDAARVLLVEVTAAGPEAKRRYRTALQQLTPFLEEGYDTSSIGRRLSPRTSRMAIGSAASLVLDEVVAGRTEQLPALLPELVWSVLVPFVGPREAAAQMAAAAR